MARPKNAKCPVCGRRAHPDGIRHLPSKRYQARLLAPDGRRHTNTFQTVKDAEAWLHAQFADISSGKWKVSAPTTNVTFADFTERWLATRKVKGRALADRTVSGYRDLLTRFILPTFGPLPLGSITREQVERWYDRTAVDTPTYRAKAYSLLRTILAGAVADEHLAMNPARIRGAGQVDRRHRVRPATLAELDDLTAAMPPRYRLLVQLAAFCALRFGELTELRRADVDTRTEVGGGVLRVRRAVVMVDGQFVVKTPKSNAGVRDVAIPPHLMPMVRAHLLEHTAPGPDGLLFPSRSDPAEHLRQSSLARVFYPAREAVGRKDLRFHDLRHTGAVLAAQTGATLAELMGRLGHSTSQAAMRYQHVAADRDALIAARLSEMAATAR
jgi:integrase